MLVYEVETKGPWDYMVGLLEVQDGEAGQTTAKSFNSIRDRVFCVGALLEGSFGRSGRVFVGYLIGNHRPYDTTGGRSQSDGPVPELVSWLFLRSGGTWLRRPTPDQSSKQVVANA